MQPSPRTPSRYDTAELLEPGETGAHETSQHSSTVERLAAVAGGTALLAYAARHRSWRGVGAALAGAPLVFRGLSGRWPVPDAVAERAARAMALSPVEIETSITVDRDAGDLYAFWRKLENLPRFMKSLDSVEEQDGHSRWMARTPVGRSLEWQAEVVEERPGKLLSWRSLPGSQVEIAGSVLFEPATGGRGTVVRVTMELRPAGMGKTLGKMLSPMTRQQVREDLRRFKNLMEAGEVPTTAGQPAGSRSRLYLHNPL